MNPERKPVSKNVQNSPFYWMVDHMKPAEKMAQFKVRRGWFWRMVRFLNQRPFDDLPLNHE